MPRPEPGELFEAARGGDRSALARLLSLVERGGAPARAVGRLSYAAGADAHTVGITGPPGAGKSTLTSALVRVIRRGAPAGAGPRVAVLAVDPSSPFTGGAILGDRIRMNLHDTDDAVFIRSMASRGQLGGLAVAAPEAARLLTAVGFPWVLLETVGVGQVEVDVVRHADTTVVVVNPGWGDAVQAAKAGLTEIADVFVVNKADRPGAHEAIRDLERMLEMAEAGGATWRPPVLPTTALSGEGAEAVWQAVLDHREHTAASGDLDRRRRERAVDEMSRLIAARLMERARSITASPEARKLADGVAHGRIDPWSAVDELLDAAGVDAVGVDAPPDPDGAAGA
ncbi:MAG: methylmalonyl Co-A mutase-associated GTPase MeaB [Acidimicrobiia bacterium]